MKKLVFRIIFGFVFIPASLGGTLYYLNKIGFFNISKIEVRMEEVPKGQERFLEPRLAELEELLGKHKGSSLWGVELSFVSKELNDYKWIEAVHINRSWPSTLSIRIQPFEVKLLLLAGGKLVPIIKDGSFLDPVEAQHAPDVTLLSGDLFQKKSELRRKAVDVIDQIPQEGAFSRATISEVRFDAKEGFWMTMIKTGIQVKMGDELVPLKSTRVSQVIDYLESHQLEARVIDANLSKKVLVRLRKDP